jgi:hypothetical protein
MSLEGRGLRSRTLENAGVRHLKPETRNPEPDIPKPIARNEHKEPGARNTSFRVQHVLESRAFYTTSARPPASDNFVYCAARNSFGLCGLRVQNGVLNFDVG